MSQAAPRLHAALPAHPPAGASVRMNSSALCASLGARLLVAAVLCAVMWGAVLMVVQP